MGKRILALCCLLALLCGCSCNAPANPESGTTQSETAPDSLPVEPRETGSEPPTQPGGVRVQTDYSKYTPYQPPQRKYTRLSDGPLTEFVPSDSYGRVCPYIESAQYTSSDDGYSWRAGVRYGLVDATGRILTDGIYNRVDALRDYSSVNTEGRCCGFWVVEQVLNARMVIKEDEYGMHTYPESDTVYGLIAGDGSFALPCEYVSIGACGDWILCTRDWTTHDTEIRDKTGKLLFNKSELFDPEANETWINYGEGLYCLYQGDYLTDGGWVQSHLYFCDAACNQVLGPYRQGEAFSDGLACVSLDGRNFGYIDHSGAWVIPPEYADCSSFRSGRAIQKRGNQSVLLDREGNELLCSPYEMTDVPCGYSLYSWSAESTWFYDRDGKLLFEGENRNSAGWSCLDEQTFYTVDGSGLATIHSLNPNVADLEIPDISFIYTETALQNGEEIHIFVVVNRADDGTRYLNTDLREDPELAALLNLYMREYVNIDPITDEQYHFARTEDGWKMEGPDGSVRMLPGNRIYSVCNGLLTQSYDAQFTCYYTLDGALIFSYPVDTQD